MIEYNKSDPIDQMITPKRQYPFEFYASIIRYTDFDFSKDSSWIMYISDKSGQFNLWKQPLSDDHMRRKNIQLTDFVDDSVRAFFASPVDETIIFFADHKGGENFQIYKLNSATRKQQSITRDHEIRYEMGKECFSGDGQFIIYCSNEDCPGSMLVYMRSIRADEKPICLTPIEGWFVTGCWSPDNKKITCVQILTLAHYDLWILEPDKKHMSKISSCESQSRYIPGPWSPDNGGFYIVTDFDHEYYGLAFYDLIKEKMEWILNPDNDIEHVEISRGGDVLVWSINDAGYSRLYTKNLESGEIQKLDIPNGVIDKLRISPDGKRVGFLLTSPVSPNDIYIIELKTNQIEKITNSLPNSSIKESMTMPDLTSFKSFDGTEIPALLYKPNRGFRDGKKAKKGVVMSIHGGPFSQERPTYAYDGLYQFLANNGVAILAPNFRGSTGYGKSFEREIYHDWGGKELRDLEYATRWLLAQEWVDPNRVAVFGGSFGGFAALSCITRLSEYSWCAAVNIMGPSNLVTFTKSVPLHWKRFMNEFVGDPEREEDFLLERSPSTYVHKIKTTPALIIQGANDCRVNKFQTDEIVDLLRKKGIYVQYLVFEDEGHGFTKHSNMIKAFKTSGKFLVKMIY